MMKSISLVSGILMLSLSAQAGLFSKKDKGLTDAQIIQIVENNSSAQIASAALEKKNGKIDQAKSLADWMTTHSQKTQKDVKALAKKLDIKPEKTDASDKITKEGETTTKHLSAMKGRSLDRAYIDKQIEVQKKMLSQLDNQLIPHAKNTALKAMLQDTRKSVNQNLLHAQAISRDIPSS